MHHISSNTTLFLRIFAPTFWMVFFGIFALSTFFMDVAYFGEIPAFLFRIGAMAFFLLGGVVLYFTLMRLKRVEASCEHLYVSNYFKTVRYTWESVESIRQRELAGIKLFTIRLAGAGRFGSRIHFLGNEKRLLSLLEACPERAAWFK
jgi:hypothetical protein